MNSSHALMKLLVMGELRSHAGRAIINVAAIALGVAMGYCVYLINHAAVAEFSQAARSLTGQADIEISGPHSGFDEELYGRLAQLPQVAAASPQVEVEAYVPKGRDKLKLLGIDVFRAAQVNPGLVGGLNKDETDRLDYLNPSAVFLSPAALAWLNMKQGDTLSVQAGLNTIKLRIAGTLRAAHEGLRLGVMDIGAAQWRFGLLGRLARINLKLQPGVDAQAFQRVLRPLLPPGVAAATPDSSQHVLSDLSRAYRVNLGVLALVALFTGAFLVFSSQALSVVARRSQLALLRALGLTRGGLLRWILIESAIQGLAGSILGILAGVVIADGVLRYAGGDLGGGYFPGIQPTAHFDVATALVFIALGVAAAIAGCFAPAWEASRARPATALRAGDEETPLKRLRSPWPALALSATGVALTQAPPVEGLPIFGYMAVGLLLVGAILWMPRLVRWTFGALSAPRGIVPYLAVAQLAGAPGRASVGLAGVLASFSLMAAMAIMVSSFRVSFDQWLNTVLPAQLYINASGGGDTGYFSDPDQRTIASTPGVARAEFTRTDQLVLNPQLPPATLIARPIDARHPGARLALVGPAVEPGGAGPPPVWVSEAMVDLYGMHIGRRIDLPLAGRQVPFTVAGVWRDYARQYGAVVINLDDYRRVTGDDRVAEVALWLAPGIGTAQTVRNLRQRLSDPGWLEIKEPGEIRAASLHIFDRSFAVTYLLEGVAIVIGLFGVGVSFGAQALTRSREFGMLRHIGFTRRQIGAVLSLEGALLGALGVGAGLGLGWAIALILVHVINPQSFHWTMEMHMPWGLLAAAAATLVAAAAAAAAISGRRAMSSAAVRAVREDW